MAEEESEKDTGPSAEDIEKMQAALKKANEEAAKYRHEAKAKDEELAKLKEAQDSSKSEMDKVREQIEALSQRAEKAEREALVAKVAQAKKLPPALAGRLSGSSQEELEADADQLIEALGLGDEKKDDKHQKSSGVGRPKEDLQAGASNESDEPEITPEKGEEIAESIRKSATL